MTIRSAISKPVRLRQFADELDGIARHLADASARTPRDYERDRAVGVALDHLYKAMRIAIDQARALEDIGLG